MDELAGLLGHERVLLEGLLFKLVELRQLLSAGEARFLTWAAEEVERATDTVRDAELRRAVALARPAHQLGLVVDSTLREVAELAPDPYGTIFAEHRAALLALTGEVEPLLDRVRRLAGSGADAAAELLDRVSAGVRAVGETTITAAQDDTDTVVRLSQARAGYELALAAAMRVQLPSLTDFLR